MDKAETLLFSVGKDNTCRIGLPPAASGDNYHKRAITVGKLENAGLCFFNPDGKLFVVRGEALYKGPTPTSTTKDWFTDAKCVGRTDWDKFKVLYFHPGGKLFAVTKAGAWYKGPEPENEHVPWLYRQASAIGASGWERFSILFFDLEGIMYGVTEDRFLKADPLSKKNGSWALAATNIGKQGWEVYSYFMGFSYDGNLWCVSRNDGKLYTASPPTNKNDTWITRATDMGTDYRIYKTIAFGKDKTIKKILKLNFLPDIGKILATNTELVAEQVFDNNKSTIPLKATFMVSETVSAETAFTHEHGFEIGMEAEATFEAGIPFISKGTVRVNASASTSHNWNFTKTNKIEKQVFVSQEFEVGPGHAVTRKAVMKKSTIDLPYTAKVLTTFGYEVTISGTWKGVLYYNMHVVQEDI